MRHAVARWSWRQRRAGQAIVPHMLSRVAERNDFRVLAPWGYADTVFRRRWDNAISTELTWPM